MLSIPLSVTLGHQVRSNAICGSLAVYLSWPWSWCFLDYFLTLPPSSARARALPFKGDHCSIFMLQWTNMACICTYIYVYCKYILQKIIYMANEQLEPPKYIKCFLISENLSVSSVSSLLQPCGKISKTLPVGSWWINQFQPDWLWPSVIPNKETFISHTVLQLFRSYILCWF